MICCVIKKYKRTIRLVFLFMCHNPVELTAAFFLSVTVEKHHFLVFPTFYFPSDHTNPLISLLIIILIMGTEDTFQIWICHSYSLDYCTPLLHCTFRNNKVPLYLAVNKCESETQGIAQAQVRDVPSYLILSYLFINLSFFLWWSTSFEASFPRLFCTSYMIISRVLD